ncbi:MAG: hypothetical protein IRZ07_13990 [Microbispora sp.]|nr:hypothetical protein [Microbispora sp.]
MVYSAEPDAGGRVIVTLYDVTLDDPDSFLLGVDALRRLPAFHLVPVLDAGTSGGRPYLVTEPVDGPTLAEKVTGRGPLTGPALHRLAVGTATALVAVHEAGAVHGRAGAGAAGARRDRRGRRQRRPALLSHPLLRHRELTRCPR